MEPAEDTQQIEKAPEVKDADATEEAKADETTAETVKEGKDEKEDKPVKKMKPKPAGGKFVTDAVRNFVPGDEDKYIKIKTGDFQRLIFGEPRNLVARENEQRRKFDEWIKDNKKAALPSDYLNNERLWLRFLQGSGWNYQQAYDEIQAHFKWKKETYPIDARKYKDFLNSGALYVSCRAKRGLQPVIVMNLKKFIKANMELSDLETIACYYFDYLINHMLLPGHVENWILIVDMKEVGITELPVSKLKGFLKAMQLRFRGRMYRVLAINSHWLLRAFWNMVISWMDAFIQQKIIVSGYDYKAALEQFIDNKDLENQYGGTKPDVKEFFLE